MGAIQQGINQLIGTTAIVARLTPGFETRQELREINKRMEHYKKLTGTLESKQGEITQSEADVVKELGTNIVEDSKRRLNLRPTSENLAKYEQNVKAADEINKAYEGQMRAQQKAAEQLQQKEKFSNFREQISSDIQDTINLMQGKDVLTQEEMQLDEKLRKMDPSFDKFSESAKQIIRKQFKGGDKK